VVAVTASGRLSPDMTTWAFRMPRPSAVVTRPAIVTPDAVSGRNSSDHPPLIQPLIASNVPPSSLTYRLQTPFELESPNVPFRVCGPVPPIAVPGSLYGAGGAGAGKSVTGDSQLVGSNIPDVSIDEFGSTWPAESININVTGALGSIGIEPPASPIRINFCP